MPTHFAIRFFPAAKRLSRGGQTGSQAKHMRQAVIGKHLWVAAIGLRLFLEDALQKSNPGVGEGENFPGDFLVAHWLAILYHRVENRILRRRSQSNSRQYGSAGGRHRQLHKLSSAKGMRSFHKAPVCWALGD